jgi:hypothetical protein
MVDSVVLVCKVKVVKSGFCVVFELRWVVSRFGTAQVRAKTNRKCSVETYEAKCVPNLLPMLDSTLILRRFVREYCTKSPSIFGANWPTKPRQKQ